MHGMLCCLKCIAVVVENGSGSQVTEARFLRAFYYYNIIDLFGQAPYREAGSALTEDPKVWSRAEATGFAIGELEAIIGSLPKEQLETQV
jgi:hypothetical protein